MYCNLRHHFAIIDAAIANLFYFLNVKSCKASENKYTNNTNDVI